MEFKVGEQWGRTKSGVIGDVTGIYRDRVVSTMRFDELQRDVKTADTPQELIQVGDYVVGDEFNNPVYVGYVDEYGNFWSERDALICNKEEVTEIWTKTDDNTYKRQWVKE